MNERWEGTLSLAGRADLPIELDTLYTDFDVQTGLPYEVAGYADLRFPTQGIRLAGVGNVSHYDEREDRPEGYSPIWDDEFVNLCVAEHLDDKASAISIHAFRKILKTPSSIGPGTSIEFAMKRVGDRLKGVVYKRSYSKVGEPSIPRESLGRIRLNRVGDSPATVVDSRTIETDRYRFRTEKMLDENPPEASVRYTEGVSYGIEVH